MNSVIRKTAFVNLLILFTCGLVFADKAVDNRWWPVQKAPKKILKTSLAEASPTYPEAENYIIKYSPVHMMLQSLSGLTAKAVNEGSFDEMVWIDLLPNWRHQDDYRYWYKKALQRLEVKVKGHYTPFELLEYLKDKGVYKGYVLYSIDQSEGPFVGSRPWMDSSANAATVAAGILDGVLISEELEPRAKKLGLKKLLDVRGKDESWAFLEYKERLNRNYALAQDPKMPRQRALAIANKMMVFYEMDEPADSVYEWLNPLSSIIGYNGTHEGQFIEQLSRYGHILPASNWCMNLPILSAETEDCEPVKFEAMDLAEFKKNYDPASNAVSFIMSDGDNVQWLMGDFCFNKFYWASPDHGDFPFGWGLPFAGLDQVCTETMQYLKETQPKDCTLNLHAGGYYMPDVFGVRYSDKERIALLRKHAKRLNYYMKRNNSRTLQFICDDIDGKNAMEAYKVFAEEIEQLAGIFVLQYAPYTAEEGKIMWVRSSSGVQIPVINCKYTIWANYNQPDGGTPSEVAQMINKDADKMCDSDDPYFAWTIIHAWSGFKKANGEIKSTAFEADGSWAGVTPTKWCVDELDRDVNVVSPEELLWRIRMNHNPAQTKEVIDELTGNQ
ncbi:GxGYxYP domain-containing protein [Sedimentisphaera salicampi]|uniref:Uncharacterized protein n=1 Tax=Sedimentisphaera salicampi TaxID=1941349 RepID=A0A1W6LIZ8_9BACT|nr:GxGYxYP domain-containing protein [Sedimentisphaera salicampi]ARN55768.1 hypothetical protein STSP1_00133 [Sedimentisphaera salicampi]